MITFNFHDIEGGTPLGAARARTKKTKTKSKMKAPLILVSTSGQFGKLTIFVLITKYWRGITDSDVRNTRALYILM